MARENALPGNIIGKYYVNHHCIDCGNCRNSAPLFFSRRKNGADGHSIVHKQPALGPEENWIEEIAKECPTEAIQDDGESESWKST